MTDWLTGMVLFKRKCSLISGIVLSCVVHIKTHTFCIHHKAVKIYCIIYCIFSLLLLPLLHNFFVLIKTKQEINKNKRKKENKKKRNQYVDMIKERDDATTLKSLC